ncbi:response regulator [Rosistilla oblonga]|uniref:response regulator n=1 Tax=Rosistilla oblonga TaxID=2527990 RepID=UPI003A96C778
MQITTSRTLQALVVDDDAVARKTVAFALQREDFECDLATDGEDASRQLARKNYDLVVTDLRMPNKNGHALTVELLARKPRSIIVVHSCIDVPDLARDLMLRGVDDIVYKPTNYAAFAAKAKGLVLHRQPLLRTDSPGAVEANAPTSDQSASSDTEQQTGESEEELEECPSVSVEDIESKRALAADVLPVSKVALKVFELTRTECDARELGAAIQCDAELATKVLSISNSSFYRPIGKKITELDKAVVQIGLRRIGELTLAAAMLSAITQRKLAWMNAATIWQQCNSAGVAAEHLIKQGSHASVRNDLVLISILNFMGRVVLGSLYPEHYQKMIAQCQQTGESLRELEQKVFPENHAEALLRLQTVWNFPSEICKPMSRILDSYSELSQQPEPLRRRVELVKLSVFVGKLAMSSWHSWDLVEIPPASVLERLRIDAIDRVIEDTNSDTQTIVDTTPNSTTASKRPARRPGSMPTIHYLNRSPAPFDFVARLIDGMDFRIQPADASKIPMAATIVVNCLGLSKAHTQQELRRFLETDMVAIVDCDGADDLEVDCQILQLPASYGAIRSVLFKASVKLELA